MRRKQQEALRLLGKQRGSVTGTLKKLQQRDNMSKRQQHKRPVHDDEFARLERANPQAHAFMANEQAYMRAHQHLFNHEARKPSVSGSVDGGALRRHEGTQRQQQVSPDTAVDLVPMPMPLVMHTPAPAPV